ncbi:MAG: T9SS type A sorting domain-containing protein [Flavobacteriia bacterium]|jgi:hypothetical protein
MMRLTTTKLQLLLIVLLISTSLNAQFSWSSWSSVSASTSGTISTGTCVANVSITQTAGSTAFTNTSPRYQAAGSFGNGSGLFISHDWGNVSSSTTVTINFTTPVINPCFEIDDINTQRLCYTGCTNNWSDEVQVSGTKTSGTGTVTVTSNSTGSGVPIADVFNVTLSGVGNTTATVSARPNCSTTNYHARFCLSGTFTQITIIYRSGPWFSRSALATFISSANCGTNTALCRSELTNNCSSTDGDPNNQHIKIGAISTTNCFAAMPVEFVDFHATCLNSEAQLNWSTFTELNNDYFTIERSLDGLDFEEIVEVSGNGTTSQMSTYKWTDDRPIPGTTYYRLSQTDYNGEKTMLGTLSSEWPCNDKSNDIQIFPNPTDGDVNLIITNDDRENYSVEIFDAIGQLVIPVIDEKIEQQGTTILKVKTSELSAGIFLMKVVVGERVYTEKLIIKK